MPRYITGEKLNICDNSLYTKVKMYFLCEMMNYVLFIFNKKQTISISSSLASFCTLINCSDLFAPVQIIIMGKAKG